MSELLTFVALKWLCWWVVAQCITAFRTSPELSLLVLGVGGTLGFWLGFREERGVTRWQKP